MTASALYEGTVVHRRAMPPAHAFRTRLFMPYLDLAELPRTLDALPLWSARRRAPARFRRADHLGHPAVPLETAVRDLVHERTGSRPRGPVRMLAHLRYLGHCFNPIAVYWCFAPGGERVEAIVAEVTNTPWGERHAYVAAAEGTPEAMLESRHAKALHVSPFLPMDVEYRLRVSVPGERIAVAIDALRGGEPLFAARLALRRRPLTARSSTTVLLRHPAMTLRVLGGIYGQALRLRAKGARWHPHPEAAA